MPDVQYLIDTICARFTAESLYRLINERLEQGPFATGEILPLIQAKDRSLDHDSAKLLAEAALEDLVLRGELRREGNKCFPAK